jgi:hypothetical protein
VRGQRAAHRWGVPTAAALVSSLAHGETKLFALFRLIFSHQTKKPPLLFLTHPPPLFVWHGHMPARGHARGAAARSSGSPGTANENVAQVFAGRHEGGARIREDSSVICAPIPAQARRVVVRERRTVKSDSSHQTPRRRTASHARGVLARCGSTEAASTRQGSLFLIYPVPWP